MTAAESAANRAAIGEDGSAGAGHWLNGERVRVYSWMIVAIFAIVFVVWLGLSLPDLVDPRGKPLGYDFIAFWSAARLALEGRPEAAYDLSAIAAAHRLAVPALHGLIFAWHYPPTFLLAILPFGLLGYPTALGVFVLSTAALWAGLIRRVATDRRAWVVAAAAPAGLINLLDGQNGFLTAGLAGFALLLLARRPVVAGVLIGLLAIKPHLAVLFPLALLADRQWRSIFAAALTTAVLAAASVATFGWGSVAAFLHDLPASRLLIDRGAVPWGAMPSPYVFVLSLGAPALVAGVLQGLVALFAAACVYRAWRNHAAPFEARAATLLAGSLLVPPFLFAYDLTWASLAVGWLAMLGLRTGFRRGEREILLFAWLVPALMSPVQMLTAVQLGFPAVLLLLVAAVRRAAPLSRGEQLHLRRAVDAFRIAPWLTRRRVMTWGVGFALVSLVLLGRNVAFHTANGLTATNGAQLAGDFANYFAGAKAAASGQASLVYDNTHFTAFERSLVGPSAEVKLYPYPPTALLLSLPLALLPFVPALIAWVLLGVGLCAGILRRLVGWQAAALAAVGAPAAFFNLFYGQNGYFTAALFAGGLILLERRPAIAGICFGCLAYKPHLALLVPFALAAGGQWRAFAAAAATAVSLALASLALFGIAAWAGFLGHVGAERHWLEFGAGFWTFMPSVFAAARLLGASLPLAYAAQLVSGLGAVAATVAVWRAAAPIDVKAATLVVATFLATPFAWDYDTVILIFAAAWLADAALRGGFLPWERLAIIVLLTFVLLAIEAVQLAGIPIAPVLLWLVLALLLRRAVEGTAAVPHAAPG